MLIHVVGFASFALMGVAAGGVSSYFIMKPSNDSDPAKVQEEKKKQDMYSAIGATVGGVGMSMVYGVILYGIHVANKRKERRYTLLDQRRSLEFNNPAAARELAEFERMNPLRAYT